MDRCSWCGLPKLAESSYGPYVSLLHELYIAVKTCKGTDDENERFLAQIEIDFLLQQLFDQDHLIGPS